MTMTSYIIHYSFQARHAILLPRRRATHTQLMQTSLNLLNIKHERESALRCSRKKQESKLTKRNHHQEDATQIFLPTTVINCVHLRGFIVSSL